MYRSSHSRNESNHSARTSKKHIDHDISMIINPINNDINYNSRQKILKLRGSIKPSQSNIEQKKRKQLQQQNKKNNCNNASLSSLSLGIHQQKQKKQINPSNHQSESFNVQLLKLNKQSKQNKQNKQNLSFSIQPQNRKKSSQKGLNITRKKDSQFSYFVQGYGKSDTQRQKANTDRYQYVNQKNTIDNSKTKNIYIDNSKTKNHPQIEQIIKDCNPISNFYSQRNSRNNIYDMEIFNDIKNKSYLLEKKNRNLLERQNNNLLEKENEHSKKSLQISCKSKLQKSVQYEQILSHRSPYSTHQRIMSILQNPSTKVNSSKRSQSQLYNQSNTYIHQNSTPKYNQNSFQYVCVVGRGGFGKVWKVVDKKNHKVYALKEMSKALIISKKSVPSVMNQQQLLKQLKHTFIVNMCQSFQTRQNLYVLMDFLSGGDLRYHLAMKKTFTQDETKFIVLCILMGLKYLHQNQIIHRDIKPQNIVLDQNGYARITDLGVARKFRLNNANDTSGTPGYMAPQVLCRQNHSYSVDYFAVGVIAYQLMLRKRPYHGKSRKQIRDEVLSKQVQIKKQDIPDNWSLQGADFVNRLIQRKPSNRLGSNSIQQIFQHPWLQQFPLHLLSCLKLSAPYLPKKSSSNAQHTNTSSEDTQTKELINENQIMLRQKQVQSLFDGYDFC